MMNQLLSKRVFSQALAGAAVVALYCAIALAQNTVPSPAAGARTDGEIEMDVVHTLHASNELKSDLITAATIQSEVTLSGIVSSQASRELAESIVGHVPGVTKVNNNLKVGNPQGAPLWTQHAPSQPPIPAYEASEGPVTSPEGILLQEQTTAMAQDAGEDVGVGPALAPAPMDYGPPVCDWGYYSYYPYACAPYGFYGPNWFYGGVF